MTELIFIVCLASSPSVCEQRSLLYTDISPRICVLAAGPELARWAGEHPGWNVRRWSCRLASEGQDA